MAHLFKRGRIFYLKYYVNGKQKELSLRTPILQIAKEKERQFESGRSQGLDNPLPTRTALPHIVSQYVDHIRAVKTPKSAQNEIYYLREVFGAICPALTVTSRKLSTLARKRPSKMSKVDARRGLPIIETAALEEITPAQIAQFIEFKVRDQGLAPKTANHYRSILRRLFNWAKQQGGVRLPQNANPAAQVRPYKENAPQIRYLTLPQIDEQLFALRFKPQLHVMVAMLIYAGMRREELLWLTLDDVDLTRRNAGHGLIRIRAKTIAGESWQPKTKVNRAVPISAALRSHLDRYKPPATKTPTPEESAKYAGGFRGWFFPSPDEKFRGRWDTDNFSADLRAANADAGLQWSCLDYRHTFGSQLAQAGVSLFKIATLMGNSPEICRRHYAALVPENMVGEVDFATVPNANTEHTLRITPDRNNKKA